MLADIKGKINSDTVIVGDSNLPLPPTFINGKIIQIENQ